jgi:hypothetical protein
MQNRQKTIVPTASLPGLDDAIRAAAKAAVDEVFARLCSVTPLPKKWLTEAEVEQYLGWARGTLGVKRYRGDPVPPSFGEGKMRRTKVADVDAWVESQRVVA